MSLAIAVKVPEGLVLAAESRVSYDVPHGEEGKRLVTFDNATKLLEFDDYKNFGAITFGTANIGTRTAHSFLPEFLNELKTENVGPNVQVKTFAKKLSTFFARQWQEVNNEADSDMIFVVGGFDSKSPYAQVYSFGIPSQPEPEEIAYLKDNFNSVWGGQNEIVARMIRGFDDEILNWISSNIPSTSQKEQEFRDVLASIELPIVYSALALQDAINLAETLIRTTIDIQSLTAGIRGVGGPIDIAIITKENGFSYIQKKTLTGKIKIEKNHNEG